MKKRIKLTLLFGLFVLSTSFNSKTSTNKIPEGNIILEIKKIKYDDVNNLGEIIENDVLIAYYFFTKGENTGNGNALFKIKFYDVDFKYTKSIEFNANKNSQLINIKFNGKVFLLEIFDNNKLDFFTFTKDGKLIGENRDVKLKSSQKSSVTISNENINPISIYSLGEFGFIINTNSFSGLNSTQTIEAYNNNLELKWSINTQNRKESSQILFTSSKFTGIMKSTTENGISNTFFNFFDSKTGVFKFKINIDNLNEISIKNCFVDEFNEKIYLIGEYLQEMDKKYLYKSLGLFLMNFDFDGNLISNKQFSWADKLSNLTTAYDGKQIVNDISLYIHKIHRDKEGKIYVIGEQYKNTTYFGLNNINLVEGNKVLTTIYNMAYLTFDKDFKLIKNETVKKVFTKIYDSYVPASYISTFNAQQFFMKNIPVYYKKPPFDINLRLKKHTFFDYQYSIFNEDGKELTVYYIDKNVAGVYENEKEICYGSINLGEGDTKTQKKVIKLNSKDKKIYPSSKNNILLLEYFTFKKKLIIRKESLE